MESRENTRYSEDPKFLFRDAAARLETRRASSGSVESISGQERIGSASRIG